MTTAKTQMKHTYMRRRGGRAGSPAAVPDTIGRGRCGGNTRHPDGFRSTRRRLRGMKYRASRFKSDPAPPSTVEKER